MARAGKKSNLEVLANEEIPKDLRELRRKLMSAIGKKDQDTIDMVSKGVVTIQKIAATAEVCAGM